MEFWGIEIKPGVPIKVEREDGCWIRVSQATLGESEKVNDENIRVFVKVGENKTRLPIGILSKKIPQFLLDLYFEQDFELSHDCKTSSVYLFGHKTYEQQEEEPYSDFDSEDEDIPMDMFQNDLAKSNALNDQKATEAGESESDEEDDSDSDEMGSDEDEDDSDEEEEEEEEEEQAPLKVEPPSKKMPNGGAKKQKEAKHGPGCCVPPKARRH